MPRPPAPSPDFPAPPNRPRLYEQVATQIADWIRANDLQPGDRIPAERDLAARLGVSRATLSQALVALEVVGIVEVRHGDGTVVAESPASKRIAEAVREHADRLPEVLEARDALESKLAALAARRRTDDDLVRIDAALAAMEAAIEAGGRGVEADEAFHGAVTAAAHSGLLSRMMDEIAELVRESRIESLSQPRRPAASLEGHRAIAEAIRRREPEAAASAMHAHIELVSDVAVLRET